MKLLWTYRHLSLVPMWRSCIEMLTRASVSSTQHCRHIVLHCHLARLLNVIVTSRRIATTISSHVSIHHMLCFNFALHRHNYMHILIVARIHRYCIKSGCTLAVHRWQYPGCASEQGFWLYQCKLDWCELTIIVWLLRYASIMITRHRFILDAGLQKEENLHIMSRYMYFVWTNLV